MTRRALTSHAGLAAVVLAGAALIALQDAAAQTRARNASRLKVPALESAYPMPPLPERSPRNANYTIDARLDPDAHAIKGTLLLDWTNLGTVPVTTFPFHLDWNAYRDNSSTFARGNRERSVVTSPSAFDAADAGSIDVTHVRLVGDVETDVTSTLRNVQPDDGNVADRTVMEVRAPFAVEPGQHARFRIDWTARVPHGDLARAGYVHDYYFVAQWFPKIGVLTRGGWNAHQLRAWNNAFADYGTYDVTITLPRGHLVGATGGLIGTRENPDGSESFRFVQEDVDDFAWTASRRFVERTARFEDRGFPSVDIRLLIQPEHAHLADRYLEATRTCLRSYGSWTAPYPYSRITVIDPAWSSASRGLSYPMLVAAGASVFSPPAMQEPEAAAIDACGRQFMSGLVVGNENEEGWFFQGLNRYLERKARFIAYGPERVGRRYFGPGGAAPSGIPVRSMETVYARNEDLVADSPGHGAENVEENTALTLATLEGLLGDDALTQVLRTYTRRFRFAHPTSREFIEVVNEVTGRDYEWFFKEVWSSRGLCDYAVTVTPAEGRSGSDVTVRRAGDLRLPVELRVEFEDGRTITEAWDGQDRSKRFVYAQRVARADVDPDGKIALDVRPTNNTWLDDPSLARREATKWAARYLFWLQGLMEVHLLVG